MGRSIWLGFVVVLAIGCATTTTSMSEQSDAQSAVETTPAESFSGDRVERSGDAAVGDSHQPTESDQQEELVNRIKWSTASEVDNFGYNVFRGTSEDGPFERVNEEIIEGAGTTDLTSRYEFVDRTIDPRRAYWYYVESISMNGTRERFTPVVRVAPKLPPDDEP